MQLLKVGNIHHPSRSPSCFDNLFQYIFIFRTTCTGWDSSLNILTWTTSPNAITSTAISIGASKSVRWFFPNSFFVGHRFFFQHCLRNHKNSFTLQELTKICNQQLIYITKGNQLSCHAVLTSNLSESHSHAPSVGLHGHQLQFFVCLGRSSKSFNDQMRRDDLTPAEQHGKHGPFLHENDTRQHGRRILFCVLLVTCNKIRVGETHGRAARWQWSTCETVKWRCLTVMKSEHSKKLRFHFNWNYFQLKTYALPFLADNVSSNFWMAGSLRTELKACACGSWKLTCHASRGAKTVKLKTACLSRDHHSTLTSTVRPGLWSRCSISSLTWKSMSFACNHSVTSVGPSRTGDQRGLWHHPSRTCWISDQASGWWSAAICSAPHPKLSHLLSPDCFHPDLASGWWSAATWPVIHPKLSHLLSPGCLDSRPSTRVVICCNLLSASPKAFPPSGDQIVVRQRKLQGGDLLEFAQLLAQGSGTFQAQIVGTQIKLQGGDFLQFSQWFTQSFPTFWAQIVSIQT